MHRTDFHSSGTDTASVAQTIFLKVKRTVMKANRPLGNHIRQTFMLFAVVPMVLAVITCLVVINGVYRNTIRRDTESDILNIGEDIQSLVESSLDITKRLAQDPDVVDAVSHRKNLDQQSRDIITAMLFGKDDIMQLHILSRDGVFRFSTGSIPNLFTLPVLDNYGLFYQLNRNQPVIRATKYYSYTDKQIALNIGTPICIEGSSEPVGYVIVDIKHSALDTIMHTIQGNYVREMMLADDRSVVACDIQNREQEGLALQDRAGNAVISSAKEGWNDSGQYLWKFMNLVLYVRANDHYLRPLMVAIMGGLGVMCLIALLVAYFAGTFLSGRVTKQFRALWRVIRAAPEQGFEEKFIPRDTDFHEIVQLGNYYNETSDRTRALIASIEEKQNRLATAELNVLKAQLRPHFLYNVLNDIKALAKLGKTSEIVQLVVCFSKLLRSALTTEEEFHTLSEELDLIRNYITMENLRGLRPIELKVQVPESLEEFRLPRLLLQPLVENATVHGLIHKEKPVILVRADVKEDRIEFCIADNGCGIGENQPLKPMDEGVFHQGIGIKNIQKRLQLYYGEQGRLKIRTQPNFYTAVYITVPRP